MDLRSARVVLRYESHALCAVLGSWARASEVGPSRLRIGLLVVGEMVVMVSVDMIVDAIVGALWS